MLAELQGALVADVIRRILNVLGLTFEKQAVVPQIVSRTGDLQRTTRPEPAGRIAKRM